MKSLPAPVPCSAFVLLAALACAAAGFASAPAPATKAAHAPALEERTEVVAIEVPVNIVDRAGDAVRGLREEDFQVLDDGRPQKLTGFEVVDLDVLSRPTPGATAATEAPPAERLPAPMRRHILLLFDLSYSTPTSILKARLAAREFVLHDLQPSDLAAIATVSIEHGVQLVVTFTPDRAQLARGIDTLGLKQRSDAFARNDPLQFMIAPPEQQVDLTGRSANLAGERADTIQEALREYLATFAMLNEREQRNYESVRLKGMAETLGGLAHTLSGISGRKQVVLFSEGFDSRLMLGHSEDEGDQQQQEAFDAAFGETWKVDSDQRFGSTEVQGVIGRMLEEFRRADCVIQAVDVGGLRAGADQTPGRRGPGQDALFYMANETGGELVRDANQLRPELDKVLKRTAVTYLLTFQRSDLKADGSYHRLTVKAKLPAGARMAYRSGYYAPRPYTDLPALERNLLASDSISAGAPRRDLEVSVLTAAFRSGQRRAYVPVIVEVGGAGLLEGQAGDHVAVELYGYVSDEHGEMQDFFSQVVAFNARERQQFQQGGLKYYGHLELAPGRYLVRVLVRNSVTGKVGVESQSLVVPDYAGPVVLPPFFIEAPGRWLLVREKNGEAEKSVIYPFVVKGEPFVPSARPRLPRGEVARLCLVGYNLGDGAPKLAAEVLGAGGQPVAGGRLELLERTATGIAGYDQLLASFSPQGLAPGSYTLRVDVSGRPAAEIPFDVMN